MTKRDFQLIAEIIVDLSDIEDHERVARTFTTRLRAANPRFDAMKFLRACGVESR